MVGQVVPVNGIRLYVEKRPEFAIEAAQLSKQIADDLGLRLTNFQRYCVYDVFGCTREEIETLKWQVFAEKATDLCHDEIALVESGTLAFSYRPGQFDQRADSAQECIQLLLDKTDVIVQTKEVYRFDPIPDADRDRLINHLVNPVDSCLVDLSEPLRIPPTNPEKRIPIIRGFRDWSPEKRRQFHQELGLAMSLADLDHIISYFQKEQRDPTETEIRVLDTYWSDHCRHTTFETVLDPINLEANHPEHPQVIAFELVQKLRQELRRTDHPLTLMELATLYQKWFRKTHPNHQIEVSDEVNAASIIVEASGEEMLVMFKNETHNHPTEIEPFGGASTCLGGAIRDPLAGRSVVYQGLRVTGAADVLAPVKDTLPGKLPQKVITKKATHGFSSYGNQIGIPTTYVRELFHPGYVAKRLEVGAVIGAIKRRDILRGKPLPGDWVILVGGKTGRDGIGGATGSSKTQSDQSLTESASEVQKGNAPIERKLQRLFGHPEVTRIIKKCNDFGAGGVAVAIGELAEGLRIDLDQVPTKYQGLSATELALSESQERMALVIDPGNYALLEHIAASENLSIHHVADVTAKKRLVMVKGQNVVVDIERAFLDTNGVRQQASVFVADTLSQAQKQVNPVPFTKTNVLEWLGKPGIALEKGMIEHFDATIGRTTVFLPFGGKTQMTEIDASVQKIPIPGKDSDTVSIMTVGGNPDLMSESPFLGSYLAVVEALAKTLAVGGDIQKTRLSFQEYFRRLGNDPANWGSVFQALLGAVKAQADFEIPAIGGKDSMSGSYQDLHVPPTLLAFALTIGDIKHLVSPEFKVAEHPVYLYQPKVDRYGLPDSQELRKFYRKILELIRKKTLPSLMAVKAGGWIEALVKMGFGNQIGCRLVEDAPIASWNQPLIGGLVIESSERLHLPGCRLIGETTYQPSITHSTFDLPLDLALEASLKTFSELYPCREKSPVVLPKLPLFQVAWDLPGTSTFVPKVFIPAFPGTNCEMDSFDLFQECGANAQVFVFRNQTKDDIRDSIQAIVQGLDTADIFLLPGGFSAGDEPDGSGKYITAVLLNPFVKSAIQRFLARKGLILGICNGFQALIKSGLLPWGRIGEVPSDHPTLAKNLIGRHMATMVRTKLITNASPWFWDRTPGEIHTLPVSHGEGRFVATQATLDRLILGHQIATQYVDQNGEPTLSLPMNPNGSLMAIEGILSPDGLILGKMGHSERDGKYLYQNYPLYQAQPLFQSAIQYLKKR